MARLWYELPVDRNRRVMAIFKPVDSGGLPLDSSLFTGYDAYGES